MKAGKAVKFFEAKNGKKVKIRYLKFEDWPDCLKLINSLVREDAMIFQNKPANKKMEMDWIAKQIKSVESNNAVALVAEVDGKVVGFCDVHRKKFRQSHVGSLGISILKPYRGVGIGKALTQAALELAKKELGLKIVILEVFENNRIAKKLYKKLGFKVYGKIPKALRYKGKYVANVCMYKEL